VSNDEMPVRLGSFSLKKENYLWFKEAFNPDVEEDFSIWYKVAISKE
jgi:hypothetical protein